MTGKLAFLGVILTANVAVLALFAVAQEKPKAVQVDEFGMAGCEEILARTDNFAIQLSNNPNALGIVIIQYDLKSKDRAHWYRRLIRGSFLNRYDIDRLKIIQDQNANRIGGSFWLVPPGADEPLNHGRLWPDETLDLSKPFLYDYDSDEMPCNPFTPKQYADLIRSNPKIRGRILIHPMFRSYQFETANQWAKTFVEKYHVPRNRFKIVFGKRSDPGYVEFWIVPVNKKK